MLIEAIYNGHRLLLLLLLLLLPSTTGLRGTASTKSQPPSFFFSSFLLSLAMQHGRWGIYPRGEGVDMIARAIHQPDIHVIITRAIELR